MNLRTIVSRCSAAGLLVALAACNGFDEKRYLPTSADFQDALQLSAEQSSVPADGFSTTRITATITRDADPTRRTIVFKTTKGTFAGSGEPENDTIDATADTSGTVSVLLRSTRTIESATVSASVKTVEGLSKQVVVQFAAANPSDTIQVSPSRTTAPADGATVTLITAQIAAGLPAGRRTVTFTTTLGTFVAAARGAAATEEGKRIEADADASNHATVYLQSPNQRAGDAFVTASVDPSPAVSATTSVRFTRALPDRLVITADAASLMASFSETTEITVTLIRDVGVPTEGTVVQFSAEDSAGADITFFSDVTTSDAAGVVTATFTPGDAAMTGPATITATVAGTGVTASITIQIL